MTLKKVFTNQNLTMVVNVQNLLLTHGISTELRNVYASGASGSLAFTEVWPELWIEPKDVIRAEAVLQDFHQQADVTWVCAECKEENPASFDYCWNCGQGSPSLED